MKKIYWFISFLFLFTFGVLNGFLRKQISFLLLGGSLVKDSIAFFENIDIFFGFFYPLIIVFFYFLITKITALLYDITIDKDLLFFILLSLFPLFVFQFVNLYYLYELDSITLNQINQTGTGYIIPSIDVKQSKKIINLLTLFPLAGIILYLYRKNIHFYTIIKIIVTPIIIYLCSYLIFYHV